MSFGTCFPVIHFFISNVLTTTNSVLTTRGVANFCRTRFLGRTFEVRLGRTGSTNLRTFHQIRPVRLCGQCGQTLIQACLSLENFYFMQRVILFYKQLQLKETNSNH
uniref:Putative secreted protein n=1 Tax=Ixodes ricinus TaxID=34613 RepID=A0A6B0UIN3_IXORI